MAPHVLRPLYVLVGLVALVLLVRSAAVPADFGIGVNGYMYGWHRKGNEAEWRAFTPKYKPRSYCYDCHAAEHNNLSQSPHLNINCQNCHGPALNHPDNPTKLAINRDRSLCLRCHAQLPYPTSGRAQVRGIDPAKHNPGIPCATCHNPHKPNLGGSR